MHRLNSVRFRLTLLVLLAVAPALVLELYTAARQRRLAASDVADDARRMTRIAAGSQARLIEGARQLLVMLAQLPEVRGTDAAACSGFLARLRQEYPLYANLGVIETNGAVFASAVAMPGGVNLADRQYFREALATREFAMGEYQIGRITGKPTVNFGYPIVEQGQVRRVVFAALELAWLEQMASEAELPRGAVLAVIDRRGTALARWPEPEKWRGQSLTNAPIVTIIFERHEGTAEAAGPDGVRRLYAFTPLLQQHGTILASVSIGIPTVVAYAEADQTMKRNLLLLGIVATAALAAAWFVAEVFILRRLNALVNATHRLEAGDLTARTGLNYGQAELGQLAQAFDRMAARLEQRSAERNQATEALRQLNQELEHRVAERTLQLRERNEQMEADLAMASEFQLAFLPQKFPTFPTGVTPDESALRFTNYYRPSGVVGGDFYDIFRLSDTQAGIFVCDVMGHGVRAALVTAIIRGLVEELKPFATDPGRFLSEINHDLADVLHEIDTTMFASAFYLVADIGTGQLRYARAGHPSPIHLRRSAGSVAPLSTPPTTGGGVLGLFGDTKYQTHETALAVGDALILYTDGIFEVVNAGNEEYGEDRLLTAIQTRSDLPPGLLFERLLKEVEQFADHQPFADDICLVAMEVARLGAPTRSGGDGRASSQIVGA